ncbi:uncharacterized protein LOC122249140 [Penaeus japonicus]|uniref:uncharacterized protein LOC122249140 n=1 Tax=Penaeus japonicus TaxID=27405 RepID=UPI001C70E28F|nr:uncharacterized protein LOC122249140 [Penaeus japonicus]
MASRAMFLAVLLASACVQAEEATPSADDRVITAQNGNLVLSTDLFVYAGIVVMTVLGIIAVIGFFIPKEEFPTGYYAPSAYAVPAPVYTQEHSSYSVHRSLEKAANKYQ